MHSDQVKVFLENIEVELILSSVYYHLPKKVAVAANKRSVVKTSGFFSSEPLELCVATKKPFEKWFPILLHEYSHYKQWKENSLVWSQYQDFITSLGGGDVLFSWVQGEVELDEQSLDKLFELVIALEKDAEERTVLNIIENKFPVDLDDYIKGARSYLLFYHFVKRHKKWYVVGFEPYNIPELINLMPSNFEDICLTKEIEDIFLRYYR